METVHFPEETAAYRQARGELLKAERDLRQKVQEVAAMRRRLPLGGKVTQDYEFEEMVGGKVKKVRLSELFGDKSTLVLYSFMYGPKMKAACPLCTSFLDGIEGQAHHIRQNVALAVSARSPIKRVREHAKKRGWKRMRLLSSAKSTYQRDYFGESAEGDQLPMMNVFTKRNGEVFHFWGSELLHDTDPTWGGDSCHIDTIWALWNVLDLTPEGRGATWYPQLKYSDE